MYRVPHYQVKDREEILRFMREYPLAAITGQGEDGLPVATFVPTIIDEDGEILKLRGHIARKSDHHRGFAANPDVLALFSGPNCPIRASWYTDPISGGTWNYMTVHVRGRINFLDDEALRQVLRELSAPEPNEPTRFDNLPAEYVDRLLPAVVAFELEVSSLDGVFKLSQNKDDESFVNIVSQLRPQGKMAELVAEEMVQRR